MVAAEHYAKGSSNTATFHHGLYRGGLLVGAALWLPPTANCARGVHSDWRRVLALSRLVVLPSEPQNAASLLIGGSIRLIRKTGKWAALVTFADLRQGHTGGIYRATNWIDKGLTDPQPCWVDSSGKQVSRLSTRSRTSAEMRAAGYTMIGRFAKRRFVLVLK